MKGRDRELLTSVRWHEILKAMGPMNGREINAVLNRAFFIVYAGGPPDAP